MIKQTILYLLAVFQIYLLSAQNYTIPFYDGDFSRMQVEAEQSEKPYFIFFTTPECDPCSKMMTYTFSDEELVSYIDNHYLAYKISVDNFRGEDMNLIKKYDVMFYPTVILFDAKGEFLEEFTGFKVASDFLNTLEKYEQSVPKDVVYKPIDSLEKKIVSTSFPPPIIVDEVETKPDQQAELQVENLEVSLDIRPVIKPAIAKPSNLFKISVSQQPTEGYGVQLGVFREYTNVIKEVQRLENNGHDGVLVNFGSWMGAPVFKVVIGPFGSSDDAEVFKDHIEEKEGRKGMVVKLSKYGK